VEKLAACWLGWACGTVAVVCLGNRLCPDPPRAWAPDVHWVRVAEENRDLRLEAFRLRGRVLGLEADLDAARRAAGQLPPPADVPAGDRIPPTDLPVKEWPAP